MLSVMFLLNNNNIYLQYIAPFLTTLHGASTSRVKYDKVSKVETFIINIFATCEVHVLLTFTY